MSAKLLFLDIETTPLHAYSWGPKWQTNLIEVINDSYILCMGYRWGIDGETQMVALPDFKGYKPGKGNDKKMMKVIHALLEEADIVVGHNGDRFDIAKINSRLLRHRIPRPKPYKTVDTKKVAKRVLGEPSNSLADLCAALGIGAKTPHTGFQLWKDCMAGDPAAWALMIEYCANDVDLLAGLYAELRNGGWIDNHPNVSTIEGSRDVCRTCGSYDLMKRGYYYGPINTFQQYQCNICNSYSHGRTPVIKAPKGRLA